MLSRSFILFCLSLCSTFLSAQKSTDTLFRGTSRFIESITITNKNKKTIIRYGNQNKIISRENYLDDKLHGLKSTYTNYNENIEEETEYKNGKKNGVSKEYNTNGVIKSTSEYKNDTLNGIMIKYYDIGTIQSKDTYVKGIKLGKSEYYYKSGKPAAKYTNDTTMVAFGKNKEKKVNQVHTGNSQTWYESGFKKEKDNYIKGKKNGISKAWYENGKLKYLNNYVNDARTGHQLSYHQNGNLQEDITIELEYDSIKKYNKTFYSGKYLKFDDVGNPVVKGFYKNRQKHGAWQEFNNGKIYTDAEYKNGYPVGTLKVYHTGTTQVNRISHYKEMTKNARDTSCLDGELIVYYVTGNLAQKQVYKDCKCISNIVYHENGNLSNQQEVKDSLVYSTSYYKNGTLSGRSVAKYDVGKDIANLKFEQTESYYENGQLRQNFSHQLNPLRVKKEYNDSGMVIFRKYNVTNEIGIETEFYPGGALRSESIRFTNYYKTPGIQYLEWFENGNPKRLESYGFYQINWLSDGTFYNAFTFKEHNPNAQADTVFPADYVNELYASLSKSSKRTIDFETGEGSIYSTYNDQQPKIDAYIEKGVITNYLKAYYFSGKPMVEFILKNGEPDGLYKSYFENGVIRESGNYCRGKVCGIWTECNFNEDTLKHYQYSRPFLATENNKTYTFLKEYYSQVYNGSYSNKLKSIAHYKDGKLDGYYAMYNPNGTVNYSRTYKNGIETGPVKSFWQNGYVNEEYTLDSAGQKQGAYKRGMENGKTLVISTYKDNLLDGPYKSFWPNGKLRGEGVFEKDKKTGNWKMYDSLGVFTGDENYSGGNRVISNDLNICNCKTETRKIGFAPLITDLVDVSRANIWQFGFHEPITKYMSKLFYMNFQTSSSSSGQSTFAGMDVISFGEIITRLPDSNGIEFVLNPCAKFQDYSRIGVSANISKNDPNDTQLSITSEMFSFRYDLALLKPVNQKTKQTDAWFKVSYLNYRKEGIVLHESQSLGFTPSLLMGTKAIVELTTFTPCIKEDVYKVDFNQVDFLHANKVARKDPITGIINGEGFLRSADSSVYIPITHVLITQNYFAAEIVLHSLSGTASEIKYKVNNTTLNEADAIQKAICLFNNNTLVATKKQDGDLIISFLIKIKK